MICFFDTSALIKKYITEKGSELVKHHFTQSTTIAVSSTTKIECFSVINRMLENLEITAYEAADLQNQVGDDFFLFEVVPFSDSLEKVAIDMIKKYQLRTLDAMQLASALSVYQLQYFIVSDVKLKTSGKAEGLIIIDPNETQL
ncbi:MAG: type II toxin-antitoxin system VapC family toxin [Cytophagales bacterium]|jgi:predicted nucleic acid-binding protein|nr:type II toxin-antitoxin system VapC family toxin [Cytophagales bacterium]MCA6389380.1 type II toxin-antitoxin system VapC family toxin [Cytophagales bacterium]MCA6393234.1 type II toxin-antitoxin system VapC family toxin [Cytophagales bacterium]MCA6396617.1 type II toxin-antitoxin system VapC family toxin [Cytophagales bacterium]MCA6397386.1 type II toxin-antitoxin system VapC family toxin [Cytophagales bacterium]